MENTVRTDMASEAHRLWKHSAGTLDRLPGVEAWEEKLNGLRVSAVSINDEEGASILKKPIGHYYTLELDQMVPRGDELFFNTVSALAQLIRRCLGTPCTSMLMAALGNDNVAPDALGPLTADYVFPTRHLKAAGHPLFQNFSSVAVSCPGVLGTSGLESAVQIMALCREIKPECVIAVDALAGSEVDRLCRSIQISDSGIAPGSGVGNDRAKLDFKTLGIPVIAIGVPTVIEASYFADDENLQGFFVTPKDIGSCIKNAARLIGFGIDLAVHPSLSIDDVSALID